MKSFALLSIIALPIIGGVLDCDAQTLSASQTLDITLQSAAQLGAISGGTFVKSGANFGTFETTVTVNSRIRTAPSGSGSVTLQFSADFSGIGGPEIASSDLRFQCASPSYGTACLGMVHPALSTPNTIHSFGGSACTGGGSPCSGSDPNQVTLQFSIPDRPAFKTGTYTASGTLTIGVL